MDWWGLMSIGEDWWNWWIRWRVMRLVTYGETKKLRPWKNRKKLSSSRSQFFVILVFLWYLVDFYKSFRGYRMKLKNAFIDHIMWDIKLLEKVSSTQIWRAQALKALKNWAFTSLIKNIQYFLGFFRWLSLISHSKSQVVIKYSTEIWKTESSSTKKNQ